MNSRSRVMSWKTMTAPAGRPSACSGRPAKETVTDVPSRRCSRHGPLSASAAPPETMPSTSAMQSSPVASPAMPNSSESGAPATSADRRPISRSAAAFHVVDQAAIVGADNRLADGRQRDAGAFALGVQRPFRRLPLRQQLVGAQEGEQDEQCRRSRRWRRSTGS